MDTKVLEQRTKVVNPMGRRGARKRGKETANLGNHIRTFRLYSPFTQSPKFLEKTPPYTGDIYRLPLVEDNGDPERDDSRPYSPGQVSHRPSPSSQAPVWRSVLMTPEHSGISFAFTDKNEEIYSTRPVPFSRVGSVYSTGSPRSRAGLRYAGSLDPDQYRDSSFDHSDTEHRPVHNHYPIVSNTAPCSRRDSVPHPSPHDARQGMVVIPHGRINPGPWETS